MPQAGNTAAVRRFHDEVWNQGNLDVADEIFSDEEVRHDRRPGTAPAGAEGQKAVVSLFRAAFPDIEMVIDFLTEDDEIVVACCTITETHQPASGGIPPTGNAIWFSGVNIYRFAAGKIIE